MMQTFGGRNNSTEYGQTPMLCDGAHGGVHEFEIKVETLKRSYAAIGIDDRNHQENDFRYAQSNHYAMFCGGGLYGPQGTSMPSLCRHLIPSYLKSKDDNCSRCLSKS